MAVDLSYARRDGVGRVGLSPRVRPGRYLGELDLFRVMACLAVVSQHSVLWIVTAPGNVSAWYLSMFLHFSRNAFFFLAALVACYSQIHRPRPLGSLWKRRYLQIIPAYLLWTCVYFVFTLLNQPGSAHHAGSLFVDDLFMGYDQLYAIVVILQFYLLMPGFLWILRKSRHHVPILAGSVAIALLLGFYLQYFGPLGVQFAPLQRLGKLVPWSRDILTYQEFFVAGALVAFHFDAVTAFVERHCRRIIQLSIVVALGVTAWYFAAVGLGANTAQASSPYQPVDVVWFGAAIAGLGCLSWWWKDRYGSEPATSVERFPRTVAFWAELTGGVYLCHVLFLNLTRWLLAVIGLRPHLSWFESSAILLVGTLAFSVAFVLLVLKTVRSPLLRRLLTGPDRAEQKERLNGPSRALPALGLPVQGPLDESPRPSPAAAT